MADRQAKDTLYDALAARAAHGRIEAGDLRRDGCGHANAADIRKLLLAGAWSEDKAIAAANVMDSKDSPLASVTPTTAAWDPAGCSSRQLSTSVAESHFPDTLSSSSARPP